MYTIKYTYVCNVMLTCEDGEVNPCRLLGLPGDCQLKNVNAGVARINSSKREFYGWHSALLAGSGVPEIAEISEVCMRNYLLFRKLPVLHHALAIYTARPL